MKLLWIVPYTPTPIRTRPYNLVRTLAARDHAVTLATLWENEAEREGQRDLAHQGIEVITAHLPRQRTALNALMALASNDPLQARYCWQPELTARIAEHLARSDRRFDVIHVEHLRGAEYGRWIQAHLARTGQRVPVVWDSVDCISLLFEQTARRSTSRLSRWIARLELPRTRRYEARAVRSFAGVLAASARDAAALDALGGGPGVGAPKRVLPNGVDSGYFLPAPTPSQAPQVVLTGKMSYHANVTAAVRLVEDIMPIVWGQRSDVSVVIAGSAPTRRVRELAERNAPRVTVLGHVADIRPHLQAAGVAVAPITYGAGIQNKVLEAMACGIPVVASPQASSALRAVVGTEILVASEPNEFAQAVLRLLGDPGLGQRLAAAGRSYVVKNHQWTSIVADLEGYYDEFAGAAAEPSDRNRARTAI
jgi:glycosyltransferase involved in cell wall biosynthesis